MFSFLRGPLVWVTLALLATNLATAWTTKLYLGKYERAVAECNADKLRATLESERIASEALRAAVERLQEIRDREREAARKAVTGLHRRSEALSDESARLRERLNEALRNNSTGCLVEHVPDGVWNAVRGDEAGSGGGSGTGADPSS